MLAKELLEPFSGQVWEDPLIAMHHTRGTPEPSQSVATKGTTSPSLALVSMVPYVNIYYLSESNHVESIGSIAAFVSESAAFGHIMSE